MNYPSKEPAKSQTHWSMQALTVVTLFFSMAAVAEIAQTPLFLTTNVKPNILIMLDNSLSMNDTLTVTSGGTTYDPATTYLANKNCSVNALPTTTTSTQVNTSIKTKSACNAVNGSWSSKKQTCTVQTTTTITYSTSIPSTFVGYKSGKTLGTQCFDSNKNYTTSLTLPAGVSTNAQKANYLNWYYSNEIAKAGSTSTRIQVAKTAANALVDSLPGTVRLGLATFNTTSSNTIDGGKLIEAVDDLTTTKKSNIKNRIDNFSLTGYTPLSETLADIGKYFATGSNNVTLRAGQTNESTATKSSLFSHTLADGTGWRTKATGEPGISTNPIQYSCQKSYTVFLTDGLPTRDRGISSTLQDYDGDCSGSNASQCTGVYDMKKAYAYPGGNGGSPNRSVGTGDESSDFLDDVAHALFEMDLRPDLRNSDESSGAKNNLTTFLIGFADDSINPDIAGVNPLPKEAAEQGGGKFYFAGSEYELTASLANAFSIITEQASSSSSVATNSTQYQTDTLLYQAIFDSNDWSGNIQAFRIESEDVNGNGVLDSDEDTNGNGKIDTGAIGAKKWDAASKLATIPSNNRNIISYNPELTDAKGIEFSWNNLNSSQQGILQNADIVNYLRGDQSKEKANGGTLRDRVNLLGDVVSSDPLFVGRDDAGYSSLPENSLSNYSNFAKTTRRDMIYVAANDGMLHGFDASTGTNGGIEVLAYLPNAAITSTLVTLSDPNYAHKYINDGSAQAGDVFFNNNWHTVLVGSLGAGGQSLYALDITEPDNFGTDDVLWEFSETDLGYTLPQATIIRTATTNQWAAIVGNGYGSALGKAALIVINIQTGAVIKKIEADTSGDNGLSSPVAVDVDGDKIADYVYAGDLKGNMWKFDISSANPSDWNVANNGSPLFIASDSATPSAIQPITAKPAATKAAGSNQTTGTMVYFGTGKYFEVGDNIVSGTPQIQTFYGIWDKCDKSTANCTGVVSGRSELQQQAIIYEGSSGVTTLADGSTVSGDVRVVSNCEVAYGTTIPTTTGSSCTTNINRRGWYIDFIQPGTTTRQGERIVSTAVIRHDVVIFPTLIPINETCSPGGNSWLMELDLFSGARIPTGTPVDLNNDDKIDDNDLVKIGDISFAASGFKSTVGIIDTPAIINCEDGIDCKYASGSSGQMMMKKEKAPTAPPPDETGGTAKVGMRRSWQQLR